MRPAREADFFSLEHSAFREKIFPTEKDDLSANPPAGHNALHNLRILRWMPVSHLSGNILLRFKIAATLRPSTAKHGEPMRLSKPSWMIWPMAYSRQTRL